MTPNPTPEAVEAAARAIKGCTGSSNLRAGEAEEMALAALRAAAPLMELEWRKRFFDLQAAATQATTEPGDDYVSGLRCGVEDRDITDRYEAAEYGWRQAFEYAASCLPEGIAPPEEPTP